MADTAYSDVRKKYAKRGLDCLCGDVRMAARAVTRFYDSHFEPLGAGANQIALLWAVMALEPASVNQLARAISADATTLTRNLKRLEKDGLLKSATGDDRRERLYTLSRRGQKLMMQALPRWEEAQHRLTVRLGRAEFRQAIGLLLRIAAVT